jgi:hypothetical protein
MDAVEMPPVKRGNGPYCKVCGWELEREICAECDGEGWRECYEDDPLWYDEDDTEPCTWCDGRGGYWVCANYDNHPETPTLPVLP